MRMQGYTVVGQADVETSMYILFAVLIFYGSRFLWKKKAKPFHAQNAQTFFTYVEQNL